MNLFLHNPIADMPGPHFLLLFICVSAMTLFWCRWRVRACDPSAALPALPLPADPDPFELAYLKGGPNETTRVTIFDLIQRGYLEIYEPPKTLGIFSKTPAIRRVAKGPDPRLLSPLERAVFSHFSSPRTAQELFQGSGLATAVQTLCSKYEDRLRAEDLLAPAEMKTKAFGIGALGALVLLGLGGYKLAVALAKGRTNIQFLVLLEIISLILLVILCRPPRLSRRGQDYLDRLQGVFERFKSRVSGGLAPQADALLLTMVALFGVAVLEGTAFGAYHEMFRHAAASGGGCGGGCGGGGCGGGGCGGGCGGCGG